MVSMPTRGLSQSYPYPGGEVAKTVKHLNQGGSLWVFKLMQ